MREFDDKAALAEAVRSVATSDDIVLLKASRGMKLEELLRYWV
ncbi:hypothetical protein LR69_01688 [Geobacillus sp. BCO2]|nr:hypothetical protein LR69_01688 [Geobacillus sp. BCO2]